MFAESRPLANKVWQAIQISALVAVFLNVFSVNLILSENWELLELRSIDDYAMQYSVHLMQEAILHHDWKRVFTFFDFAYGNAYWLLTSILLMPFHLIGSAQMMIVASRELSLFFFFGAVYVMGLIIDRVYPDARYLKFPALILMATIPIAKVFTTKLHVNMQSLLWGFLAFYFLVKDPVLKRKHLCWSAVFGGMCAGFKLTGIFMSPLLGLLLLEKLSGRSLWEKTRGVALYLFCFIVVMAATTAPVSLLFPFFKSDLISIYNTFINYKNMATSATDPFWELLEGVFRYYASPLNQIILLILFLFLIISGIKRRQYVSLFVFSAVIFSVAIVMMTIHKQSIYLSTYTINLCFLLPLGLLGLSVIPGARWLKVVLAYGVVIAGLLDFSFQKNPFLSNCDFRAMMKERPVQNVLKAGEDIRSLIAPLKLPVSVLQDDGMVFPGTPFTPGVSIVINFGNLTGYSSGRIFDYILLNSAHYYDQKAPPEPGKPLDREAQIRETLYKNGDFLGKKYKLIYERNDALLYRLVSP